MPRITNLVAIFRRDQKRKLIRIIFFLPDLRIKNPHLQRHCSQWSDGTTSGVREVHPKACFQLCELPHSRSHRQSHQVLVCRIQVGPLIKDPYGEIPNHLCDSSEPTQEQKIDSYLATNSLGDQRPFTYILDFDLFLADATLDEVNKQVFVRFLPTRIGKAISGNPTGSLADQSD